MGGRYGWGNVTGCGRVADGGKMLEVVRGAVQGIVVERCVVGGGQLCRAAGNWLVWVRLMAWASARWAAM